MASLTAAQLSHYLNRINHPSTHLAPAHLTNLETLCNLHWSHAKAVPFENLSLRLERAKSHPTSSNVSAVFTKIVEAQRGGYCYEQNGLFSAALRSLGFTVIDGAARVVISEPGPNATANATASSSNNSTALQLTPQTAHRVMFVHLDDGIYLADVGFGGEAFTLPIKLPNEPFSYQNSSFGASTIEALEAIQRTSDVSLPLDRIKQYRISPGLQGISPLEAFHQHSSSFQGHRQGYYLQRFSKRRNNWKSLYFFNLQEALPQDFDAMNFATSNMPTISPFIDNTIVSRMTDRGRVTLNNNILRIYDADWELVEEKLLETDDELMGALKEHFGLSFT